MLLSRRNNLFDDFFNDPFFTDSYLNKQPLMKTDIEDSGDHYVIDMELPGFQKDMVKAELKDGYLTILAENSSENNSDEEKNYIRRERYHSSLKRSFYVGTRIRQEDIKASFENGILKLMLPKEAPKEIEENRYIPIE
ncbi:Hsp20/alpha crystallin family protein [Lacrimispora aerotolerans]|jgi:HSP20 family molecular chaperone IbpA|uniref:Hsp20/alpha crystallin family protein n=1 Tax=Lacrimispora aerotolerans TaxID=36832 RepID=UPI00047DD1B3|nr:Hsp20/alpha crystallin family protein [Lacrimispora aerotolerans]